MEKPYHLLYPMRVCLISASHEGKANFMPASWVYPISMSPPLFGVAIAGKRYTHDLIKSSGYFVINIPGFDTKEKMGKFGRISGRDGDKFKVWGLTKEKCEKIPCVSIADSLSSLECKVVRDIELGDHILFVGELVHIKERRKGKGIYQADEGFIRL